MKFVVVGQGAIGLLWYSHFVKANLWPALLCSPRADETIKHMTLIDDEDQQHIFSLNTIKPENMFDADVIIFCLKAYDILPALKDYREEINRNAQIILCHNGIISTQPIEELFPHQTIYTLLTTHGSKKLDRFTIKHTGKGQSQLGELQHTSHNSRQQLTAILNKACPQVTWHDDIKHLQWLKLAVNCVINPLTAIYNINNGSLLQTQYQSLIKKLCEELVIIAAKENVDLNSDQLIENVRHVAKVTEENCSSMLADVRNGTTTEIEHINGYIVHLANKHKQTVPANLSLYQQVNRLTTVKNAK
ncbi:ketopantoate reductase family protein [Thalassotalea sediminis]|uniref:ketopantoate reductase family protein n=1 Tax=Thalassotalea sediminis TaxID=1759089 RepID=UPI002573F3D0|nr:2-dehydropantoate 2-reductase [Thalassotalea sediminis]